MKKKVNAGLPFVKPELSFQTCKEILCKNGEVYSDQEINEIRELLIALAEIDYLHFKKWLEKEVENKDTKIIPLNGNENRSEDYKNAG